MGSGWNSCVGGAWGSRADRLCSAGPLRPQRGGLNRRQFLRGAATLAVAGVVPTLALAAKPSALLITGALDPGMFGGMDILAEDLRRLNYEVIFRSHVVFEVPMLAAGLKPDVIIGHSRGATTALNVFRWVDGDPLIFTIDPPRTALPLGIVHTVPKGAKVVNIYDSALGFGGGYVRGAENIRLKNTFHLRMPASPAVRRIILGRLGGKL